MGLTTRVAQLLALSCLLFCLSSASEDVEFKDPHLVEIASFAATSLLKDASDLGLGNRSALHRIMDAQIVPYAQPVVLNTMTIFVSC